jgi:integrase
VAGRLRVMQTAQWLSGQGFSFRQPKTFKSRRTVDLPPGIVERLRQHRQSRLEARLRLGPAYQDHDLVFAGPTGSPIDPSNFRRAWLRILTDANTGAIRFHDLRHAHATLMLQEGVHVKVISERLGHSGIGITMDTYGHLMPGLQRQAAEQVERLFEPKAASN